MSLTTFGCDQPQVRKKPSKLIVFRLKRGLINLPSRLYLDAQNLLAITLPPKSRPIALKSEPLTQQSRTPYHIILYNICIYMFFCVCDPLHYTNRKQRAQLVDGSAWMCVYQFMLGAVRWQSIRAAAFKSDEAASLWGSIADARINHFVTAAAAEAAASARSAPPTPQKELKNTTHFPSSSSRSRSECVFVVIIRSARWSVLSRFRRRLEECIARECGGGGFWVVW